MRKIILPMMMTLDGYIAGSNGEMDWLPNFMDEDMWQDIHEEMWNQLRMVDTILLGRTTYQIWEKYWPAAAINPSSSKSDIEFSRFAEETPKFVFSKTLENVSWKNSRLIKENIAAEISRLKQQPGKNIALAGGAGLAQSFMKLDLIDEYQLTINPVILGEGKALFPEVIQRKNLKLVRTKPFKSGAMVLCYRPGEIPN